MDEFRKDNLPMLKREKNMPLSVKDPHLSHIFDHNQPHTPNSLSTETIARGAPLDVDHSYAEETSVHEYHLFDEQQGSFMADISPVQSQMILEVENPVSYSNTSQDKNPDRDVQKASGGTSNTQFTGLSNQITTEHSITSVSSIVQQEVYSERKHLNGNSKEKIDDAQLLSPPADHYNMQLLAHSALQQHQRQQQQQEAYVQGISGTVMQQLAKPIEQQNAATFNERSQLISKMSPFPHQLTGKDDVKSVIKPLQGPLLVPGQPGVFLVPLPSNSLVQIPNKSPHSIPGEWTGSERSTPDFAYGHSRNLSFGSQDSPMLSFQSATKQEKVALSPASNRHVPSLAIKSSTESGPELKSPLDHPEHRLDRQRRHFFSNDADAAEEEENDEAPLNERDKKAAAALSELLEQNEKISSVSLSSTLSADNASPGLGQNLMVSIHTGTPQKILHIQQRASTTTAPSLYQQPNASEHTELRHALLGGNHGRAPLVPTTSPFLDVATNQAKQDPRSPTVTSGHHFLPVAVQPALGLDHLSNTAMKHQSNYVHQSKETQQIGNSRINPSGIEMPSGLPLQTDPFDPLPTSGSAAINNTVMQSKVPSANSRVRKTSSSSTGRRKSDSNLTCPLCGHTFRSTPALNGHMRVHSSSDKKHLKEERLLKAANTDLVTTSSSVATDNLSSDTYSHLAIQLSRSSASGIIPANRDPVGDVAPSQHYAPSSIPPQSVAHNGLLTMASAACFLKSEAPGTEYVHPSLSQAYVDPQTMAFQQPSLVNVYSPNFTDSQTGGKLEAMQVIASQGDNNAQRFTVPFQQGLPLNVNSLSASQIHPPLQAQNAAYVNSQQQQTVMADLNNQNTSETQQNYIDQQIPVGMAKPMFAVTPGEDFSHHYDARQLTATNSLSQLASIAVAAANRDHMTDAGLQENFQPAYPQHGMQSTETDPNAASVQWIPISVPQQECIQQQPVYQDPNFVPERSPMQSGQDPYILPVAAPVMDTTQHRFFEYESRSVTGNAPGQRESVVTWRDNVDPTSEPSLLLSSYDDSLMQEAVDVANPSKILPNSMMGGTPTALMTESRPFRQRHHSEGAHLIKTPQTSLLKQILHSPIPTIKLRDPNAPPTDQKPNKVKQPNKVGSDEMQKPSNSQVRNDKQSSPSKIEEVWAEPKSIPRRIRHRRHSADFRLLLKSGSLTNSRQHQVGIPSKNPNLIRSEVRVRHRPPPLVIPSSASTFSAGTPGHLAFHQSKLHQRRRPSGDNCSGYNGVSDSIPPYTPPPMLSPRRSGSGLYCTTPVTPMFNRQKSVDGEFLIIAEEDEELVRSSEPKINIGRRFQAVIPQLCQKSRLSQCKHKADRVWVSEATKKHGNIFKHVEQFMELSCSAAVPFGGSNKEYALDCLAQTKGSILAAVRRLIKRKPDNMQSNMFNKKYIGCGSPWTREEVKLFECAMIEHRKDFFVISNKVKTRTTAECVERYYHVTKRNRRRIRLPRRFQDEAKDNILSIIANSASTTNIPDSYTSSSEEDLAPVEQVPGSHLVSSLLPSKAPYPRHEPQATTATHQVSAKQIITSTVRIQRGPRAVPSPAGSSSSNISNDDPPPQVFTCPVCFKSFGKVKSRNAHMKTHGKQAQEKRRQREEEAARRNTSSSIQRPSFVRPAPVTAGQLYHHTLQQRPPHYVVPGFGHNA